MVKKGKTRVTITINENLLKLIKLRGNVSEYINECIKEYVGHIDTPNYYELDQLGISKEQNCYKELGFYEKTYQNVLEASTSK